MASSKYSCNLERLVDSQRPLEDKNPRAYARKALYESLGKIEANTETYLSFKKLFDKDAQVKFSEFKIGKNKFSIAQLYDTENKPLATIYNNCLYPEGFVELPDDQGIIKLADFYESVVSGEFEFDKSHKNPEKWLQKFTKKLFESDKKDITAEFKQDLEDNLINSYAIPAGIVGKDFGKFLWRLQKWKKGIYTALNEAYVRRHGAFDRGLAGSLWNTLDDYAKAVLPVEETEAVEDYVTLTNKIISFVKQICDIRAAPSKVLVATTMTILASIFGALSKKDPAQADSPDDTGSRQGGEDTTRPTINITNPSDGAEFTAYSTIVSGVASDNVEVSNVELDVTETKNRLALNDEERFGFNSEDTSTISVESYNQAPFQIKIFKENLTTPVFDLSEKHPNGETFYEFYWPDLNQPDGKYFLSIEPADNNEPTDVQYKFNKVGGWRLCNGTDSWSIKLQLDEGTSEIRVRSQDTSGWLSNEAYLSISTDWPQSPSFAWQEGDYFIHVTDTHHYTDNERLEDLVNHINSLEQKPKFVVVTGDLVDWGAGASGSAHFQDFFQTLDRLETDWYILPGNHDCRYGAGNTSIPIPLEGDRFENYYALVPANKDLTSGKADYGSVVVFGLNSGWDELNLDTSPFPPEGSGLSDTQISSLEEKVDMLDGVRDGRDSSGKRIVIVMHHPTHWQNNKGKDDAVFLHNRGEFTDLCEQNDVDAVLAGHTHKGAVRDDGTKFVVTGAAGDDAVYRKITYTEKGLKVENQQVFKETTTGTVDCPAKITMFDDSGKKVNSEVQELPGSFYSGWEINGDRTETVSAYGTGKYVFEIKGTGNGTVNFTINQNGETVFSTEPLPVTDKTKLEFTTLENKVHVEVDKNGDGKPEKKFDVTDGKLTKEEFEKGTDTSENEHDTVCYAAGITAGSIGPLMAIIGWWNNRKRKLKQKQETITTDSSEE